MTEKKTIRLEKDVQVDKTYYKVYVDDAIAEVSMTIEEAETAYQQIKARLESGELLGKTVLKAETIDVPSVWTRLKNEHTYSYSLSLQLLQASVGTNKRNKTTN